MSRTDLAGKRALLEAMSPEQLCEPSNIPVAIYLREAEQMVAAGRRDLQLLERIGFGGEMLDDLRIRIGALREAESIHRSNRYGRGAAWKSWAEAADHGRWLLKGLRAALLLAYRNDKELASRVRAGSKGRSAAALVQGLSNLATLGRENSEPLRGINFALSRLDEAAALADELGEFLGRADNEKESSHMCREIRDAAYSHLKEGLKELRDHALYALAEDKERKLDYTSQYLRKKRLQRRKAAEKCAAESAKRSITTTEEHRAAPGECKEERSERKPDLYRHRDSTVERRALQPGHRESRVRCRGHLEERTELISHPYPLFLKGF